MIKDTELRELFKVESGEHLQNLEAGLLRLEKEPADKAALETVFRDVHSLKGAARMIGVRDVERIAHRIEDMLGAVKKGTAALSPEFIDRVFKGLDAIKKLAQEAVTGDSTGMDVSAVLDFLAGGTPPVAPAAEGKPGPDKEERDAPAVQQREEYRIDTIRVETRKLDALMTHSGELAVMKTRMARLLSSVDEITALCESAMKGKEKLEWLARKMAELRDEVYEDNSRIEFISGALDGGIRDIRLLPFSTLFNLFPRMVRDMARERSREVELEMSGGDTKADKRIIEEMKDPIMHIIRNSIDHGMEPPEERERAGKPRAGKIRLSARRTDADIIIEAGDDGRGLDVEAIKKTAARRKLRAEKELEAMSHAEIQDLVFESGFSTSAFVTDVSGRGVGLDVVRANVESLKGSVRVESTPVAGCLVRVKLPVTLATARVLLVSVRGKSYAVPMEFVDATRRVYPKDIFPMEGRDVIIVENRTISVAKLADILELPEGPEKVFPSPGKGDAPISCVMLSTGGEKFGVLVDDLLDEQEVALKPNSPLLKRVRNVSGITILGSGEICAALNPNDMLKTMRKRSAISGQLSANDKKTEGKEEERKLSVLLVEDSITTRTQEKRILEGGGYEVVAAVNGVDALAKLATRPFDAVVSDIMMPEMDGLTLTARIRLDKKYKDIPVILVTTLASDEDKKRGLEAGANAYIPKPSFDQKMLLETLGRLI